MNLNLSWPLWFILVSAICMLLYAGLLLVTLRDHVYRKEWEENHPGLNFWDYHR